jgi:CubicO group peptidase (beta-lactamase class C family)
MRKFILLLLLPVQLFAQDAQLEKFIDSLVGPFAKPNAPGSMILVVQDGKQLVKKAYGMANLELSVPLRTEHAFAIGSVSKQFTAVAILQLVQSGKLSLSDDIRKYIPFFDTHGKTITIENLLTHTSGISGNLTELRQETVVDTHPDNFLRYIMKFPLDFEPGTDWSYSNNGFRIASIIVERVTGQRFADYAKEHLFEPAGMNESFVADDLQPMNNVASSYIRGVNGAWRNASTLRPEWNWAKGAGNIISTLDDMYRWETALTGGKLLSPALLEKAWTSYKLKNGNLTNYGYAFNVMQNENFRVIHHNGGIYGYRNVFIYIPEKKIYIQYVNLYSGDYSYIPKKIISRLLQIAPPAQGEKPSVDLASYAGYYEQHYVDGRVNTRNTLPVYTKLFVKSDSLYLQDFGAVAVLMRPVGKDRFRTGRPEDGFYEFNRDKDGKPVSVRFKPFLYGVGNVGIENKRINIETRALPQTVTVDPSVLKNYTGTYYRPETSIYLFVELQGNRLFANNIGSSQKYELLPVTENKFIRKGFEDFTLVFNPDVNGIMTIKATGLSETNYNKIAD